MRSYPGLHSIITGWFCSCHSAAETDVIQASGVESRALVAEFAIAREESLTDIESMGGSMAALSYSADRAFVSGIGLACYSAVSALAFRKSRVDRSCGKICLIYIRHKNSHQIPSHSSPLESCNEQL